jgi:predicted amidohydrolase YtcJ
MIRSWRFFSGLGLLALAAFCAPSALGASDTLLVHGHVYTGNSKAPWAQAIAVTGTRIDAVGTDLEILARKQTKTEVIDLHGRTVIPGISDAHTHMWFGAMELHGVDLSTPEASITADNPDLLVEKVRA